MLRSSPWQLTHEIWHKAIALGTECEMQLRTPTDVNLQLISDVFNLRKVYVIVGGGNMCRLAVLSVDVVMSSMYAAPLRLCPPSGCQATEMLMPRVGNALNHAGQVASRHIAAVESQGAQQ